MTDIMSQALTSVVEKQFTNNQDTIYNQLFSGIDDSSSLEQVCSAMVINSMRLSVDMSVKIISELLLTAGIVDSADEESLRHSILSLVKN